MASRWIVGGSEFLKRATAAWTQARPEENVSAIEVPQAADYVFDFSVLDTLNPAHGSAFAAFDERFGNFKRVELMQALMARNFKLEPFISPSAIVAADAVIGPNVFVGDGVVIGSGSRVEFNTVLHAGVKIGAGVHVRSSCWLDIGVIVGNSADIGKHCILRMGTMVGPGVKIGRNCELGWPQLYGEDVPAKTYFDTRYDEPIHTYES